MTVVYLSVFAQVTTPILITTLGLCLPKVIFESIMTAGVHTDTVRV